MTVTNVVMHKDVAFQPFSLKFLSIFVFFNLGIHCVPKTSYFLFVHVHQISTDFFLYIFTSTHNQWTQ